MTLNINLPPAGNPLRLGDNQCSMAYHHFFDVEATTKTLCFFLKPGGVLLIADQMPHDHNTLYNNTKIMHDLSGHAPKEAVLSSVVRRGGFAENEMKAVFDKVGLVDWKWVPEIAGVENEDGTKAMDIFLAIGKKPTPVSSSV